MSNLRPIKAVVPITPRRLLPPFTPASLLVDITSTPVVPVVIARRAVARGLNLQGIKRTSVFQPVPVAVIPPQSVNLTAATFTFSARQLQFYVTSVPARLAVRRQVRPRPGFRIGRRTSTLVLPLNFQLTPATFTFSARQLQFYLTDEGALLAYRREVRGRPATRILRRTLTPPTPDQNSPVPDHYRRQVRPRPALRVLRRTSTLVLYPPVSFNLTQAVFTFSAQQLAFVQAGVVGVAQFERRIVRGRPSIRVLRRTLVLPVPEQNTPVPQVLRRQVRPRPSTRALRRTRTQVLPLNFQLTPATFTFVAQVLQFYKTEVAVVPEVQRPVRPLTLRQQDRRTVVTPVPDQPTPVPSVWRRWVRPRPQIKVLRRTRTQVIIPPSDLNLTPAVFTFQAQTLSYYNAQIPATLVVRRKVRPRPAIRILRRTSTLTLPLNYTLTPATFTFTAQALAFVQYAVPTFKPLSRKKPPPRRRFIRPVPVPVPIFTPAPLFSVIQRPHRPRTFKGRVRGALQPVPIRPSDLTLTPAVINFQAQTLQFGQTNFFNFFTRQPRRVKVRLRNRDIEVTTFPQSTTEFPKPNIRVRRRTIIRPRVLGKRGTQFTGTAPSFLNLTPATFTFQPQVLFFNNLKFIPPTFHRYPVCVPRRRRHRITNGPLLVIAYPSIIEPTYGVLVSSGATRGHLATKWTEGHLVVSGKTDAELVVQWTEGDLDGNGHTEGQLIGDY